jgi:hypothetical protein
MHFTRLGDLGHALYEMRVGRGPHRQELRQRLAAVDPALRRARNIERLKLANIKARLNGVDTRADPRALANLQAEIELSAGRLEALDQEIVRAIARQLSPRSP